jgi:mono/diheme cytochrome c family protein
VRRPCAPVMIGAVLLLGAGAAGADTGEAAVQLKAGAGRELTTSRCIICHSLEYIPANAPAMDRAAWQKTLQKMRERFGAPLNDEETRTILDYLSANYVGKT